MSPTFRVFRHQSGLVQHLEYAIRRLLRHGYVEDQR